MATTKRVLVPLRDVYDEISVIRLQEIQKSRKTWVTGLGLMEAVLHRILEVVLPRQMKAKLRAKRCTIRNRFKLRRGEGKRKTIGWD